MAKPSLVIESNHQFTAAQLRDMLKQAEENEAKIAAEKGPEIRKELEDLVMKKYGLTLEAIGLVEKTERTYEEKFYKNPTTGEVYRYKGFGGIREEVKAWLIGADGKRIEKYRCNEDGSPLK